MNQNTKDNLKTRIMAISFPIIGQSMMRLETPDKVVEGVLKELLVEGISRDTMLKAFPEEEFYKFIEHHNLPDAVKPWVGEFYALVREASVSALNLH